MMTGVSDLKALDPGNFVDADIETDEFRNNMQAMAAEWADRPPFYVDARGVQQVYVCRSQDMQEVFRSTDRFTVKLPKTPEMAKFDLFNGIRVPFREDGALHTKVRRLVAPLFGHKAIADNFEPGIREVVGEMLDELEARGGTHFDFMQDFAESFVARILFDKMLHFDAEHIAAFVSMGKVLSLVNEMPLGGPYPDEYLTAFDEATAKVRSLIVTRRREPRSDFISRLIAASDKSDSLTDEDIFGTVFAVCVATTDTTPTAATLVLWTLLSQPGVWAALKSDHDLVRPASEEALRFHNTSTALFLRFATQDTELGGTRIPKDTRVVLISQAASFDPKVYENPRNFDINRDPTHPAFGGGVHLCIGAPLARVIIRTVLVSLIERFPNLRLTDPGFRPVFGPAPLGSLKPVSLPVSFD